jgi:hypothetical protein
MPTRNTSVPDTGSARASARETARRPRLQLEFTNEAYERLNELKALTGSRTNAEVIRKALHVLDWVLARTREDYRIQLVKDETVREVELVGLHS